MPPLFYNRRGEKVSFSQRTTVCDGRRRHRHAGDSADTKGVQIGKSYPGIASPPPPRHKSLAPRIGMNALPFSRLIPFNSSSSHHRLGRGMNALLLLLHCSHPTQFSSDHLKVRRERCLRPKAHNSCCHTSTENLQFSTNPDKKQSSLGKLKIRKQIIEEEENTHGLSQREVSE